MAAEDTIFYNHFFFPKAFRQEDAPFHSEMIAAMECSARFKSIQVARGFSKTTISRAIISKRIAFAISRNILYIGKSESHALRSVNWMKRVLQFNERWQQTFGIHKGDKWSDTELEFWNEPEKVGIRLMGVGLTGSIRGINWDDYRPDCIILDDIIDKEKVSTPEARKKVTELVHADVKEALEAESDNPLSTLMLLETPLDGEDPGEQAKRDPEWTCFDFGCWTKATKDLPVDEQISSWPARYPTEMLRDQKKNAIELGRYYLFAREKEIKLTNEETSSFKSSRIQHYDVLPDTSQLTVVMAIDPVPPPTEARRQKGLTKHDWEVMTAVGGYKKDFYVLEERANRGHEPDWTIKSFFEMVNFWKPQKVIVETTGGQAYLSYFLRKAMEFRRQYIVLDERDDKRNKIMRITEALQAPIMYGHLWLPHGLHTLEEQILKYPDVPHDDHVDALSMCLDELQNGNLIEGGWEELESEDEHLPELGNWRSAP